MKQEEANKIIAEYMWYKVNRDCLNALVPVWEKLQVDFGFMLSGSFVKNNFRIYNSSNTTASQNKETIQQSAAIATAQFILELKGTVNR